MEIVDRNPGSKMTPCATLQPDLPANVRPVDAGQKPAYLQPVVVQPFGPVFSGLQGHTLMHTPPLYCPILVAKQIKKPDHPYGITAWVIRFLTADCCFYSPISILLKYSRFIRAIFLIDIPLGHTASHSFSLEQ